MPPAAPPQPPAFTAGDAASRTEEPGNGWLGIAVDDSLVTGRLVIVDVAEGSPAGRAGIARQDQLLAIDGVPLRTADQLAAALAAIAPGRNVKLAVGRGDRVSESVIRAEPRPAQAISRDWQAAVSVPPAAPTRSPAAVGQLPPPVGPDSADVRVAPSVVVPPREPPAAFDSAAAQASLPVPRAAPRSGSAGTPRGRTALGVRTRPVDPSAQVRFRLAEPAGALVIGVVQDLPASRAGVPPGSVIVAIDDRPVRNPAELTQLVANGPVGTPVTLAYVLPGGEERTAKVSLQSLEVPFERALAGDAPPSLVTPPPAMSPGASPQGVGPAPAVTRRPTQRVDGAATAGAVRLGGAEGIDSGARGSATDSPGLAMGQPGLSNDQPGPEPVQIELQRLRDRVDRLERRLERLR
ncbi:MAG: PDZ domain-containing protein [Planctomycetia bacterium]|nr:PDZ domain-containing protein [Planctomycetia bacterium]